LLSLIFYFAKFPKRNVSMNRSKSLLLGQQPVDHPEASLQQAGSLFQLDGKVAFFHTDIFNAGCKGLPEASFGAKFFYQVNVFEAAKPCVGDRNPPDADTFEHDNRVPVIVPQFQAGGDPQRFTPEEGKIGI
jgi:hypothetical protein